MAQYATLKDAIEDVIKTNGNKEITGSILQQSLKAIIDSLGANYQLVGFATPGSEGTNPGTPDQNVAYIAGAGEYPNFGGTTVEINQIGVFKYNGTWDYSVINCGLYLEYEESPDDWVHEWTFYDGINEFGYTICIQKDVSGISNSPKEAISAWWAARAQERLDDIQGFTIHIDSLSTSPQSIRLIEAGKTIDSLGGASSLMFGTGGGQYITVNSTDLPYTVPETFVRVKTASGTLSNVNIHVRGQIQSPGNFNLNPEDLTFDDLEQISFANRGYNSETLNGLGYTILRPNKTFAEQISGKTNTIFEIRYNFDLNDATITIPNDCVLLFYGGSLKNGKIIGQNTLVVTDNIKIFDTILLDGNFLNDGLYIEWWGVKAGNTNASINTNILNTYITPSFEKIKNTLKATEKAEVFFNQPIIFDGTYDVDIRGNLYYDGPLASTAITIGNDSTPANTNRHFYIHSLQQTSSDWYNEGNIIDNNGIVVKHIRYSELKFDLIRYFATCLKLTATLTGCASNKISYDLIGGAYYIGILLDAKGPNGFVNENQINGKYIANYSSNPAKSICTAISIKTEIEPGGNGNVFFNPCVEDSYIGVYFGQYTYGNILWGARIENVTIPMSCYQGQSVNDTDIPKNNVVYYHILNTFATLEDFVTNRIIRIGEEIPFFKLINTIDVPIYTQSNVWKFGYRKINDVFQPVWSNATLVGNFYKIVDNTKKTFIKVENRGGGRVCFATVSADFEITDTMAAMPFASKYIYADGLIWRNSRTETITNATLKTGYDYIFIGFIRGNDAPDYVGSKIYSNNLELNNFFEMDSVNYCNIIKPVKLNANLANGAYAFNEFKIIADIDLNNNSLYAPSKILRIENHSKISNGTVDSSALVLPNYSEIQGANLTIAGHPKAGTLYGGTKPNVVSDGTKWIYYDGATDGVKRYGNSSQRPSFADIPNGFKYFDTALNMLIIKSEHYVDGVLTGYWLDSNGQTPGNHAGDASDMPDFLHNNPSATGNDEGYQFFLVEDSTYGTKLVFWSSVGSSIGGGAWVDAMGNVVIE